MAEPAKSPSLPVRLAMMLLIVSASFGIDQATKSVAESVLVGRGRLSYLGDVFRLDLVRNSGAFLSLGSTLGEPLRSVLLEGFVAILTAAVVAFAVLRGQSYLQVAALSLIAGGGVGNLWDRLASGAVTDFMNLGIGPVRTGIFNVADLAIVAGVAVLLLTGRAGAPPPEPEAEGPSGPVRPSGS